MSTRLVFIGILVIVMSAIFHRVSPCPIRIVGQAIPKILACK
jgi:hypothetical protein